MGRRHLAMARGGRTADQALHAEVLQAGTDPDHIHQRIQGTHLVEVHLLRCRPMHGGFGLRQHAKHLQDGAPQHGVQRGGLDLLAQAGPMAVGRLLLERFHLQVQPPQTRAAPLLELQAIEAAQAQGRQGFVDRVVRQAAIKQGRQQHVAGQSRRAIDDRQGSHQASWRSCSALAWSRSRCCSSHCCTSRRARRCSF